MSKQTKTKSPSTKTPKAPKAAKPAGPVELVPLSSVQVQPAGRRNSQFDVPAARLVAAYEGGKKDSAFAYAIADGVDPKSKRSYLYNAMQKSLKKCSAKAWAVKLSIATDNKTIYISLAPR
jgi:hypothetical protein